MSTTLTIAGSDKASLIDWKSIRRDQVLTKEPDTLSFLIRKFGTQTYKPASGAEVVFTVGATKEFGGYVTELSETIIGRLEYIECICKDYTYALDRQLVAKTYTAQTVDDIIADLISTFSTGFTVVNVNCPVTIDKVQFNYLPISKCLEKLTELVGDYEWYVDYDKDIHFFASSAMSASFNLTDTSGNYFFNSLIVREDTHQLRNEIIIRGGLLTSSADRTEILIGDGTRKIYPLATKFASRPAVSVNGSSVTVGIENLELETSYFVMWDYNQKSIRFAANLVVGSASVVAPYQYPLILQKRDEASIASYGLFQYIIIDKTIVDLETAGLRADVELIKNAQPLKTANFETSTDGLMVGQTINIQSTIRGIDQDFKIQSIRSYLRSPADDDLGHEIQCVTADDLGINDILSKLLIKNPSDQIDISQDEFIVRIRTILESMEITDSVGTPTISSGPYVYDTALYNFSTYS